MKKYIVFFLAIGLYAQPSWVTNIRDKPTNDPRTFNFATISPGGSLTASTPATVTLTPVPRGVNGTDIGHRVYISNGTGTAEDVLITGGTATSGAASGTITFTPANNHTGAWTITSATAGIQEAIQMFFPITGIVLTPGTGGGVVDIPTGQWVMYGPITMFTNIRLHGQGTTNTVLVSSRANQTMITMNYEGTGVAGHGGVTGWGIDNLAVYNKNSYAGWIGIDVAGGSNGEMKDILFSGGATGDSLALFMRATSNGLNNAAYNNFDNYLSNLTINNCNYGLRLSGDMDGGGLIDQQVVTLNTFAHIYLNIGTGPCLDLTRFADTNFFYDFMCGYGGGPSQPGVVLNSYGPTSEEYVGNNQFFGLQVEDSMSASSVPFQINHSDSNQVFGYHNASHSGDGYAISSVSPGNNIYGYHPIAGPFYNIILLPNNGVIKADDGSNNIKSVITMVNGNTVLGNGGQYIQLNDREIAAAGIQSTTYNYISSETGSNNAIAGALSLTQSAGLEVEVVLAHSLQAGANTFAYNGGSALPIVKHTNPASNLTVAYAVGGVIKLICDGTHWLDLSQ